MNNNSSLSHRGQEPEKGILYLVGTPIGNLSDISLRALNILKNVSLVACEDTRQTKKIMTKYGISNTLMSFNQSNAIKKIPQVIKLLKESNAVALVSDAGMPSICDPGEELAREAKLNEIEIICIPGASALLTALVSSGYPSSKFIFEGFLPKKGLLRKKLLLEISQNKKTTIFFEAPHRLKKTLDELKEFCGGTREITVTKELTKKFEKHIGTNIDEVITYFEKEEVLGEFTIVLKGINSDSKDEMNKTILKEELYELTNAGLSLSAASKYLAKKNNISKSIIYNLSKSNKII
ncbi:MAG: 16S rRNA (cytidine(1402)-2'-O)-methyltransferase [Prochlorococcus marinus XMU1428]|nr:16S rRNA (cytidine(1402)-2'-O)-methyltransferase [Prochlorococcus marinus XMU1428]